VANLFLNCLAYLANRFSYPLNYELCIMNFELPFGIPK
jgi:hypothetical protein